MQPTVMFTMRIPKSLKEGLEKLSEATERPQAYLLAQALQEYLDAQRWQVQAICEAVKKADSKDARFVPHDEVVARMKRLAAKPKRARR